MRGEPSPARRVVSPPPAAARTGEFYGPIGRGETLSEIVNRMDLPEGVDVFQAMFALQQRNPEAFLRNNINLVKEGSTLQIPSAQEMASISKVVASAAYSKQLNEWLAYRNRVASAQFAESPARSTPLPHAGAPVESTPTAPTAAEGVVSEPTSGLSEDVLRIIQSEDGPAAVDTGAGDGEEINALKSQLAVMEESLLSTELENRELRERLAMLEEQIKETNKLLRVQNSGLALAEQQAAQTGAGASGAAPASEAGEKAPSAAGESPRVRVSGERSILGPIDDLLRGDMLWKVLLGLAAIVLLIGIIVYIRRRQSYAEFEETMMTGSTYDLRSQSSAFTQVPRMDSMQQSHASTRTDSQSGGLMQTSVMTEMGAPGMGAMQADEVDPVAEAEVYMAYGRDQQAMEVLQDAIRRDPSRAELKLKLLEVYHKRKDIRAFESLAEELYPVIGKDAARWGRVTEMGRRVSPKHPLFAASAGGVSTTAESTQGSGRSRSTLDDDSGGLDLISAPFTRGEQTPAPAPRTSSLELPTGSGSIDLESAPARDSGVVGSGLDMDSDSASLPFGRDFGAGAGLERASESTVGGKEFNLGDLGAHSEQVDDFKASEIATKLDLAKAYLEMGDKEAARGFIEEVLKDGNETQRQQASELASSF
ncbi:MAG: hypothetical protein DWQ08_11960 [Proteobacteria bacterium]|nr:MAG: hypothetical protein DWQ08_11960 [Pseudomonadota bacterium]